MLPLTIKSPATLRTHLHKMETEAMAETSSDAPLATKTRKINKRAVEVRSRYTIRNGTYVLFYIDGKRTARDRVPEVLGVM
jgi:hypothetical protein